MNMVSQNADRMHSDSATRGGVANRIDDMNGIRPRDVALPTPGVPSDVGIQANGLVKASFPHGNRPEFVNPALLARG